MHALRVLVIEDDVPLADMYRTALSLAGFEVDVATDGIAALWHIGARQPDVIVLDLYLPRLRGEAILTELASSPQMRMIPVVVVTGTEPAAEIAPVAAILKKPCDLDRLVQVIKDIGEQHSPARHAERPDDGDPAI